MQLRRRIPDAPPVLTTTPSIVGGIGQINIAGGQFPAGANVAVMVSAASPWGETLCSPEATTPGPITGPNNAITFTLNYPAASSITALNVYVGFNGPGS